MAVIASVGVLAGVEYDFDRRDTVGEDCAVGFHRGEGTSVEWITIERDSPALPSLQEVPADSAVGGELIGKKRGDQFQLNPGSIQVQRATIVDIVDKRLHRWRDCMERWQERFPDRRFIDRVVMPDLEDENASQEALRDVLRPVEERYERVKQLEELYTEKIVSLAKLSSLAEKTVLETVGYIATNEDLFVRCCLCTDEEIREGLTHLKSMQRCVPDRAALATLFLLEEDGEKLVELLPLAVPESAIQEIKDLLALSRASRGRESSVLAKGAFGKIALIKTDPEEQQRLLDRLEHFVEILSQHVQADSALELTSIPGSLRGRLEKVIGSSELEAIALSRRKGWVLWTDDLATGLLAKEEFAIARVWTQQVVDWLSRSDRAPDSLAVDVTLRLVQADYTQTMVTAEIAMEACKRSGWDPDSRPLRDVLRIFELDRFSIHWLCLLAGRFLLALWGEAALYTQSEPVTRRLLDCLARHPNGVSAIRALEQYLTSYTGVIIPKLAQLIGVVRNWEDRHGS